jgi:CDP-paratose 2-epimerase
MSCIYGQRQMGTEDQGWVAHFLIRALKGEPISIYGDGCQVRDVLDIRDAVEAYVSAWERIESVQGRAFNLGGGPTNAISLKQLLTHIEDVIGHPVEAVYSDWRAGDQRYYVSDTRLAVQELGLRPPTPWRKGVAALAQWLKDEQGLAMPGAEPAIRAVEAMS